MIRFARLFACLLLTATTVSKAESIRPVSEFSSQGLKEWRYKKFAGETQYSLTTLDERSVVVARSETSASGLWRKVKVDLNKTPYLNWSWQARQPLRGLAEKTRAGDDHVARVYAIKSGGLFFWRSLSICYVWSGSEARGNAWENAYTARVMTLAVEDERSALAQWHQQKRNVREDFKRFFNTDVTQLDAIAIMTDTDNSGGQALAFYGDIYFSAE